MQSQHQTQSCSTYLVKRPSSGSLDQAAAFGLCSVLRTLAELQKRINHLSGMRRKTQVMGYKIWSLEFTTSVQTHQRLTQHTGGLGFFVV